MSHGRDFLRPAGVLTSRRGSSFNSLWRMGASGGAPERLSDFGEDATGAIELIAPLSKPPDATIPGFAVPPDGRRLLLAQ